ncbi:MAG TPA: response regulator transcription factor [Acidimicrobiia bacterium]|nr:response regulator transcription factor [Acidimicrobiia bacterium]
MLGPTFPMSVVVVDADHRARQSLTRDLIDAGYGVTGAASGIAGVEQALGEACDLVVVVAPLPDMEIRQFISMIHAVGDLPVLAVVSDDVVGALEAGADDVAARPDAAEIVARVAAVLRRVSPDDGSDPMVRVGDLVIDPARREVRVGDRGLDLSRKEFDVLFALASRAGRVVSKRELMTEVWQQPYGGSDKTVDVHLSWLRKKLGETAADPHYLRTVRGVGVKLVDPSA